MILNDNPIASAEADEFGFTDHAAVLCEAISETASLPLAIGVYGSWGSGKSSFLNICKGFLGGQEFTTVWFNPWKYDRRDEIWHALIQSLLDELIREGESVGEGPAKHRIEEALKLARKLSIAIAWLLARHAVPVMSSGLLNSGDVDSVRDSMRDMKSGGSQTNYIDMIGYRHINEFERDFARVVDTITGKGRLAVFIDDLDRCRPKSALAALEALRLFTGNARCVFVIAMDHVALAEAAAAHFDGDRVKGREYLEKLINFSYYLPLARFESINAAYRSKLAYLSDDPAMWALIRENFDGNPRRIRRFINAFNLAISTLMRIAEPSRERQLQAAMLLMLRHEHPQFFDRLQTDPDAWARLEGVRSGKNGSTNVDPKDQKLLESDDRLLSAIASVSKQPGLDFPPPPDAEQITALTKAMVLIPAATRPVNA